MKFIVSQLSGQVYALLRQPLLRENLSRLTKLVVLLLALIAAYSVLFHLLMLYEGRDYSWLTGLYWTLTVMSTLGFGDITFHTDLGRLFTIVVLISGIVLLLIVLPVAFVRFYGPWVEEQLKLRAPRAVPPHLQQHVVICADDPIADELRARLDLERIPHVTLITDPVAAANLHAAGVPVLVGSPQVAAAWTAAGIHRCRAVVANVGDAENTNIVLTVRSLDDKVPVIATAHQEESIDLLELSGASHVLPIKLRLGEQLANRVTAGHAEVRPLGRYRELELGEFPVHNTPLVGRSLRDLELRRRFGINVVGVWERGRLVPPAPDRPLSDTSVVVVIGTAAQMLELNTLLVIYDTNYAPTLVIGGGNVGAAAAAALRARDVAVHLVEQSDAVASKLHGVADQVFVGHAADRELLRAAGLDEAPAVILTTNDDATNIYLTVYCRRLNPHLRIISRITHQSNLEAIHRAGADFVLSYASLGAESSLAIINQRAVLMFGAGFELLEVKVPDRVAGRTLAECQMGAVSGVSVIAIRRHGEITPNPPPSTPLPADGELLVVGTHEQCARFTEAFR